MADEWRWRQSTAIVKSGDAHLAWSPKGDVIAFEGQLSSFDAYEWNIWVVNVNGSNARNLTNTEDMIEFAPRWSPDGQHIAFIYGTNHYLISAKGCEPWLLAEYVDRNVLDWKGKNLTFILRNYDDPGTLDAELRIASINPDNSTFAV